MKKLIAALLALALILSGAALADAAPQIAAEAIDFGDFTMELDPEMPGEIYDKVSGEMLFQIYPAYRVNGDESSNVNCVWVDEAMDFDAFADETAQAQLAEELLQNVLAGFEEANMKTDDLTVLLYGLVEQDGVPGFAVVYSVDVDYSGMGIDLQATLYQELAYLSDEAFGTYIFTATAVDMDTLTDILEPLFDTIAWSK
ncbi:MAG: hypothetical protein IJ048_10265 [Clostridia bacterium]|nr:hypothetical protein [Clostridia bacterium]